MYEQKKIENMKPEDRELLEIIAKDRNTEIIPMSNRTEEGIANVKAKACDMLLAARVEKKLKSAQGINNIAHRLNVVMPAKRDDKVVLVHSSRGHLIARVVRIEAPASQTQWSSSVLLPQRAFRAKNAERRRTLSANKVDRVFMWRISERITCALRFLTPIALLFCRCFSLDDPEWRYDIIPEIIDGKNISDFVDNDIEQRLAELEKEEEALQAQYEQDKEAYEMVCASSIDGTLAHPSRRRRAILMRMRQSSPKKLASERLPSRKLAS